MNTIISKKTTTALPASAHISAASGLTFIALLALLHIVKPDLDPSWSAISEYALGDFGWIMTIAFLAWGFSAISLFIAIRPHVRSRIGHIGLVFLLIGGAGPILAGLFPTDPITTPMDAMTTSGTIHSVGASLIDGIVIAATLLTLSLVRKNPQWASEKKPLIWATVVAWVAFVILTASMMILLPQHGGQLGPEVLVGWQSRFLVVVYAAWVVIAAWCIIRVESKGEQNHVR